MKGVTDVGRVLVFLAALFCLDTSYACVHDQAGVKEEDSAREQVALLQDDEVVLGKKEAEVRDCRYDSSGFNPFFNKNEKDKSCDLPVAPSLNDFDKSILEVCGSWAYKPKKEDFLAMLDDAVNEASVKKIYEALEHKVFTSNADLAQFKTELAELWFNRGGIGHVFCGQPSKRRLSGMHFYGRYMQAQDNKWAGRVYDRREGEIAHGVYAIPVKFKTPRGGVRVNGSLKSFDFLHAEDIIIGATRAYKGIERFLDNSSASRGYSQCLYSGKAEGYKYVFVAKRDAIVTFYADLTPSCNGGAEKCDCITNG